MASRDFHVVPREVPPELQARLVAGAVAVLVGFALLAARLWLLQVVHGPEMRSLSENNRIRLVRVPAARGVVYDRHGEILIDNRPAFDVVFVPEDAHDRRRVLRNVAAYLDESESAVHQMLHAPTKRPPYEGIVLRRDLDWRGVVALETHQLELPGVSVQVGPRRYYPFGPHVFARGIRPDEWRALVQDRQRPLNNRAVQGQFPPGSTFKIAVATGALETGAVTAAWGVSCSGGIQFGSHFFRCWKKGGHGGVSLHRAIVESCDVFFYQAGQRLGVDGIAEYARRLGLGLPTGIRLEHEKTGTIPDTQWKRRRFHQPWFAGETLSVAIGQGYVTATPLQMAQMTAIIANGRTRYRPHDVKRIDAPYSTLRDEVQPGVLGDAHLEASPLQNC